MQNMKFALNILSIAICRQESQQAMLFLPIEICPQVYTDKNSTRKSQAQIEVNFVFV